MTLTDLLPEIQTLPRADKLQLIQVLVADIAREERITAGWNGSTAEIWSPYDSHEAAEKLANALEVEKQKRKLANLRTFLTGPAVSDRAERICFRSFRLSCNFAVCERLHLHSSIVVRR